MLLLQQIRANVRTFEVDFDSTEGWAMKYFAAVGMMQANGPPLWLEKGKWSLGFELTNIPQLSEEERTVGFDGTKEEDLNKSPILARPLLHYGITNRLSASITYLPPVEVFDGLKTHLTGLSVNYDIIRRDRLIWTMRLLGQWSEAEGDFTAPAEIAGNTDPEINPFGAIAPSEDVYASWNATMDTSIYYRLHRNSDTWLFLNASYSYGDYTFDVDVPQAEGRRHQRRFLTDGYIWVFGTGVDFRLTEKLTARTSIIYAPLDVTRPTDYEIENDSLVNFRLVLNYNL